MYSTNTWIFSFYLAFASSLCFYFLLFIYFFISVKPCLLIYGIILYSSCVASLLSEGKAPQENQAGSCYCHCLVLCGGPNPQMTETVLDLFQTMVLHQLMPGDHLLQDTSSVCGSILYRFFFYIPHFLLILSIFTYFTDASFLNTVLSILCECVLLILSHS